MIVGVLGLGLIGGSLARAYSKAGHTVFACEKDDSMLSFAQLAGVVNAPLTKDNLSSCELILLAIYPDGSAGWLEENAYLVNPHALVLDCCGIKRDICQRCFPLAKQYGFTFVDLYTPLFDETSGEIYADYTTDGAHLTPQGYHVFTETLTPAIDEALKGTA